MRMRGRQIFYRRSNLPPAAMASSSSSASSGQKRPNAFALLMAGSKAMAGTPPPAKKTKHALKREEQRQEDRVPFEAILEAADARPETAFVFAVISKGERSHSVRGATHKACPVCSLPMATTTNHHQPPPTTTATTASTRLEGRAANVPLVLEMFAECGVSPTFIVPEGEVAAYKAAHPKDPKGRAPLVVAGGALCASRNRAIQLAGEAGKLCCQMSGVYEDTRTCRARPPRPRLTLAPSR